MTPFYTEDELRSLGFHFVGVNVRLSRKASIYGPQRISIGNSVRIDDFCILSAGEGGIEIQNYIHIGPYSAVMGNGAVVLEDFSNISSRVTIYSSNDDYSGSTMSNPMVPEEYKSVTQEDVRIGRHVIVGSGSVILPGVTIGEGCAIGALSLVNVDCIPFTISAGIPAKFVKKRMKTLLEKEKLFKAAMKDEGR
jgi:acetyltransferase-like isoleucine patch superfamily enzyme